VLPEKQFENRLAYLPNFLRVGLYDQPRLCLKGARNLQIALPFNLNKAQSATTRRRQSRIITQVRYLDAIGKCNFKDRLAILSNDFLAVYC
jgi:hypothetical protein